MNRILMLSVIVAILVISGCTSSYNEVNTEREEIVLSADNFVVLDSGYTEHLNDYSKISWCRDRSSGSCSDCPDKYPYIIDYKLINIDRETVAFYDIKCSVYDGEEKLLRDYGGTMVDYFDMTHYTKNDDDVISLDIRIDYMEDHDLTVCCWLKSENPKVVRCDSIHVDEVCSELEDYI